MGQRDGGGRGRRGADVEGRRVAAGDRADAVREALLDHGGQQHVGDRDPGERDRAERDEHRAVRGERAQGEPGRDRPHAGQDDGARPVPAREPGRGEADQREADGRHRGEQPGGGGAHPEIGAGLLQDRADAGDGGPQVQRGQHQRERREPWRPDAGPGRGPRRTGAGRRGGPLVRHP
ncbi:hypothetical protein LUX33_23905 [Actinomadura madurae]|nr:hypothetical protein [Actinomadura madurae]MCP9951162.1 hypothetical protein [Actinomadura madurae]MCQ0008087.1 hypothetical protein [Actinomadura madurae]